MSKLLDIIKQTSMQANEESKPSGIYFGEVTSVSPLSVLIDQKFVLSEDFLILTNSVKDHELDITFEHSTTSYTHSHTCHSTSTSNDAHTHSISGKKKLKIHNALKTGEKVILLRVQGGQSYLVLDRVNVPPVEGVTG